MKSNKCELVSIVLPVYNVKPIYLYRCIKSLLNQTYDNLELIVIVDPSTNKENDSNIINVIELFQDDHRLRAIYHKQRKGLTHSLNEGIVLSKGELIARADADDFYSKYRLEYQVDFISKNHVDVVGTWAIVVSEDERIIGKIKLPVTPKEIRKHMIAHNPVINSSTIVTKKVYRSIGLYVPNFEGSEDYEFWIRIVAHNYRIANLPRYLTFLRENLESVTRGSRWLRNRLLYIALKVSALVKYPRVYLNTKNIVYTIMSLSSVVTTPQIALNIKKILKYVNTGYILEGPFRSNNECIETKQNINTIVNFDRDRMN